MSLNVYVLTSLARSSILALKGCSGRNRKDMQYAAKTFINKKAAA